MLCGLGPWLPSPPSWSKRQRDAVDSVGVAPHCRPGVQGCSCGLLLAIQGTSARESRPPRLATNFATTLNSKLFSTMKLLLLTLATLLLLSQLIPGNADLLREGAGQGDPGLVSEHPGARRTSCLGSRRHHHSQPPCQVPDLRYQRQHPEYLSHSSPTPCSLGSTRRGKGLVWGQKQPKRRQQLISCKTVPRMF